MNEPYKPPIHIIRLKICMECEHLTIVKTCNQCGCIVPLKVRILSTECPIGKWLSISSKQKGTAD